MTFNRRPVFCLCFSIFPFSFETGSLYMALAMLELGGALASCVLGLKVCKSPPFLYYLYNTGREEEISCSSM